MPRPLESVLEKLLNLAMELERGLSFWEPNPYQRTSRRRDHANGFKDKTVTTRVGKPEAEDSRK